MRNTKRPATPSTRDPPNPNPITVINTTQEPRGRHIRQSHSKHHTHPTPPSTAPPRPPPDTGPRSHPSKPLPSPERPSSMSDLHIIQTTTVRSTRKQTQQQTHKCDVVSTVKLTATYHRNDPNNGKTINQAEKEHLPKNSEHSEQQPKKRGQNWCPGTATAEPHQAKPTDCPTQPQRAISSPAPVPCPPRKLAKNQSSHRPTNRQGPRAPTNTIPSLVSSDHIQHMTTQKSLNIRRINQSKQFLLMLEKSILCNWN